MSVTNQSMASLISAHVVGINMGRDTAAGNCTAQKASNGFPAKLHRMLTDIEEADNGLETVVSWASHGRSFMVRNKKTFISDIMPKYFYQLKYNSFQRQLNLYGFRKIQNQGQDKGSFYHEFFLRGMPDLANLITRGKAKGESGRSIKAAEPEPNFYALEPLPSAKKVAGQKKDFSSSYVTSREPRLHHASESIFKQPAYSEKNRDPSVRGKPTADAEPRRSSPGPLELTQGLSSTPIGCTGTKGLFDEQETSAYKTSRFSLSAGAISSVGNDRQEQGRSAGYGSSQEKIALDSLFSSSVCDLKPWNADLALSAFEPTPLREPQSAFSNMNAFSNVDFAALRAGGLDLEPTPLRPGTVITNVLTTQKSAGLEPQFQGVLPVSQSNPWGTQSRIRMESQDESCASALSNSFLFEDFEDVNSCSQTQPEDVTF